MLCIFRNKKVFCDYFFDRVQKVKLDSVITGKLKTLCSVPQGSVFGSVLFSVYISDWMWLEHRYSATQMTQRSI